MELSVREKLHLISSRTFDRSLSHWSSVDDLAIDVETTGLDLFKDSIVGVGLSSPDASHYFPLHHLGENVSPIEFFCWLKENLNKRWSFHNAKFDWWMLMKEGLDLPISCDTMIMAHLDDTNRSRHSDELKLKFLMKSILGWEDVQEFQEAFPKLRIDQSTGEQAVSYAALDPLGIILLRDYFKPRIEKYKDLYAMELKLIKFVALMEVVGIGVDTDMLDILSKEYDEKIPALEKEILTELGVQIDLNSTDKLGKALVEKARIPLTKRTEKKGQIKLTKEILEDFAEVYPVVQKILDYRKMTKMSGTFVRNLHDWKHPTTNRIHANFLQVHVCSGRFASSDPNMQNIPTVKDPKRDVNIRKAIVPAVGYTLCSIDYSQIEVRILLALAKSKLGQTLKDMKVDIHTWMASMIFGKSPELVTPEERRFAKTITFGISYGMNEWSLAKRLGISKEKARAIIELYFEKVDGVLDFIKATHTYVHRYGFVQTYWGRRRNFPEMQSEDPKIVEYGERGAVNHIIQGSAADVIKLAMVRVGKFIARTYPDQVRMVATVHDELVFEISDKLDLKVVVSELKNRMELNVEGVPLTVEAKVGSNWGEMSKLDI